MDSKINSTKLFSASHLRLQAHYGKVFIYNNEKVYRGIYEKHTQEIKNLLTSGLIDELVQKQLFPMTKIVDIKIEGFDLVLEHDKIPLRNMYTKWSFDMLKQSALTTLEVNEIALKYGYELRDAHFLNTMFFYGKSFFIDLDSFVLKKNEKWSAYRQFIDSYMRLLQLLSLQSNFEYQDSIKAMAYYIPHKIYNSLISEEDRYTYEQHLSSWQLIDAINKMELIESNTMWKNYHDTFEYDLNKHVRLKKIIELIQQYKPKNIVDLASNAGEFAKAILDKCELVEHVVCIDRDHYAINKLFNTSQGYNITPLYDDLTNDYYLTLSDKPVGELVLALALTHHLLLGAKYHIDYIFEKIGSFTSKYILIEFMPLGLYSSEVNEIPAIPQWYTQEWFEAEFSKNFKLLYKEQVEINRMVFFGEKLL
ncbi:hypothetical protein [Aliarcobacter cryaerophilus]|uniref:hypothetical protein n=1 Tax=Aliarcobacter cryaerophilus TaxID=28198 RepID=UPI0021B5F299|nr:hypothetical protein [Aliarcobacter cryaerophilus]MCT7516348.1 hypothetical protein [Aliarcobacter cryaerophilus]